MKSHVEASLGAWDDGKQRRNFEKELACYPHQIVVLEGEDVGLWNLVREPKRLVLRKIYLLPQFQRRGVGSVLIQQLIQESERSKLPIELRYLSKNPVASLYARYGFAELKEEPPFVYVRRAL